MGSITIQQSRLRTTGPGDGSITVQQSRLRTTRPGDGQYHNPAVQTQDYRAGWWAVSQSSSPDSGLQDRVMGSITVQQSRLWTTGPGDGQYHSPAVQTQDHRTG